MLWLGLFALMSMIIIGAGVLLAKAGDRIADVTGLGGLLIGMVLVVQSYTQFRELHMESKLGAVINMSLVRELGPVLAATMLAGRVGSVKSPA